VGMRRRVHVIWRVVAMAVRVAPTDRGMVHPAVIRVHLEGSVRHGIQC
jgi:hypothetical protein